MYSAIDVTGRFSLIIDANNLQIENKYDANTRHVRIRT